MSEYSEYIEYLLERFKGQYTKDEVEDFLGLALIPKEDGLEPEMLKYLKDNPHASWKDALKYLDTILIDDDL